MPLFKDNCKFMVLISVAFTAFVLRQNLSFLSLKQQLGCVKVSGCSAPCETAVANVTWCPVETRADCSSEMSSKIPRL